MPNEKEYEEELKEPEWDTMSGKPIDLHQLLAWSTKHARNDLTKSDGTSSSSADANKHHEPIDSKWIDIIMGKSDVVRMKECMERLLNLDLTLEERLEAADELELLVEDLDNAQDFCKLNLLRLLVPCLRTFAEPQLRMHVMWILATMVQNSPQVKKAYLDKNVIVAVLDRLKAREESVDVQGKVVSLLSGFLKHNLPGQSLFVQLGGYQIVFDALKRHLHDFPFVKRVLFMVHSIIASAATKTAVQTLVASESVHNYFLNLLLQLIMTVDNGDEDLNAEEVIELSFKLLKESDTATLDKNTLNQQLSKAKQMYHENEGLALLSNF